MLPTNHTWTWRDDNGDLIPQLNELGPSTGFSLGTSNHFADDLKWPIAVEDSVGLGRRHAGQTVEPSLDDERRGECGTKSRRHLRHRRPERSESAVPARGDRRRHAGDWKVFALYQLSWGVSVSGSAQHFSGFPEITSVLVAADTVRLTRVTQSITVEPRATTRLPSVNLVDIGVRRTFAAARYSIEPVLDVFTSPTGPPFVPEPPSLGQPTGAPQTSFAAGSSSWA